MPWSPSIKRVIASFLLVALSGFSSVQAKGPLPEDAQASITVAELPRQGAQTYALILQGGPFAHEKDGSVFGNRERLLPAQKRGYYREYTVPTPGAGNRGTRRIVCGGQARTPEACYFTADHYASFRRIVP
jgi:ribonuclease T1